MAKIKTSKQLLCKINKLSQNTNLPSSTPNMNVTHIKRGNSFPMDTTCWTVGRATPIIPLDGGVEKIGPLSTYS